ncbi:MAG: porin [Aquabacterium sp.]|uniref:porin n=1 Tax=Aquabacterium sp. TaxID=1872578 RepID=UPI003BAEE0EE
MKHSMRLSMACCAIAALSANTAMAQSSLKIYGNLDVAVTNVNKQRGHTAGTVFQASPLFTAPSTVNSVVSSLSSQNALGFSGTEELGGGYKAGFILESQFALDTGAQNGQDGRMWGRQAFVSLTTPYGEVRMGRQYASMFYAFAMTTTESVGGSDIQATGMALNNLQIRQDNLISYWLRSGGLMATISYSPNAGVAERVSSTRSASVVPGATGTGQTLSGLTAGTESTDGRGRTVGLMLGYTFPFGLLLAGAYNHTDFAGVPVGLGTATTVGGTTFYPNFFNAEKYTSFAFSGKYTVPGQGTTISAQWHEGSMATSPTAAQGPLSAGLDLGDIKTRTFSVGVKQPIGDFAVGFQLAQAAFTNFTKGKSRAFMLAGDYNFSKRTKLYIRAGQMKDDRGDVVATHAGSTPASALPLAGGPFNLKFGLGNVDSPFFSGGGSTMDARTNVVGIGIRHQF